MAPGRPLPSLEALECFVAAAESATFRVAARRVGLSPNAFSQRIRQAEEQLGVTLFDRTTRRVELTEAGRRALGLATHALEAIAAVATSDAPVEQSAVELTLGTRFELGLSWLVPALLQLRVDRPNWRIHLVFGSSGEIVSALDDRRVDAIITSAPVLRADWEVEPLHVETYALVGPPGVSSPGEVLVDVDATLPLARYLVTVHPSFVFTQHILCGTAEAVRQYVLHGAGVAVLPEYMVSDDLACGRLQRLQTPGPLLSDAFRLKFHRRSAASNALRSLAATLRARPLR